ncbi:NACHT domain-containing protein [Streptomyces erythrochromogenes]|uniref:NACHT domain-containing protein n=1 Tax=Streptomyces erythrochromogenes TaxID=285574 RepID=UPI0033CC51B4
MTGFETVLLRVAGTAASALVRSLLSRTPGAGLTADPARPVPRWRRPPAELAEPEVRRLAGTLAARMTEATARLPEHERLAAVAAVGDAFAALGPLDAQALFAADLDPGTLASQLPPPPPGLGEAAGALYGRLLRLCCEHALEHLTTLPGFAARADVELVRRTGNLARAVDRLGAAGDGTAYAFEERYAQYIAATHGRLQLFGLTLSRSHQDWPLDVAYISLAVSDEQRLPGEPGPRRTTQKAEHALAAANRVLLRGAAGSGKSTLVQWLAMKAARRTEGPWSTYVPFVLRLRSYTTADALPLPEEFLKASGVPLSAPPGWVEDLMLSGRALVLVDGVDEVPQRLRSRTETWLRSLVSAFPRARYIVTTRPSAVSEDWLAGLGFTPHSLLPMERKDIGAFVAHWHRAARVACPGEDLDAYEASLLEAVTARRDLGRLTTNPLMCSLLCTLNQDRHMQLPRARKELYDAALDMLLVRRDAEREIRGVEGVYLTRDEQILLLQRFAYWLIRNGQVEAGLEEAVALVDEWLNAMPQVREQGDGDVVLRHLLIRSGLLREPMPGTVDFVHRTFQDYLGAKAAVEERDFGVLVQNAHDDTWDDVVRMAVGHARPDERTRLMRGLLRRADRVKATRNRLVLLAAACLEHAPELEPSLRTDIQSRTAKLLPPRQMRHAGELAKAGELVLELLPGPEGLTEAEAAAVVRTAALVGGPRALAVIARFRDDAPHQVGREIGDSWARFPVQEYADRVLAGTTLGGAPLVVRSAEQAAALRGLRQLAHLNVVGFDAIPPEVFTHDGLQSLYLSDCPDLTDLGPLVRLPELSSLSLSFCPSVRDINALEGLPLEQLTLMNGFDELPLHGLATMPTLTSLGIDMTSGYRSVGELPGEYILSGLWLFRRAGTLSLDGLTDRWPGLSTLSIAGAFHAHQLSSLGLLPQLEFLQVVEVPGFDPRALAGYTGLRGLHLVSCALAAGLDAWRDLPSLRVLTLSGCGQVDLTPLASCEELEITLAGQTQARGTELFPPERLRYMS